MYAETIRSYCYLDNFRNVAGMRQYLGFPGRNTPLTQKVWVSLYTAQLQPCLINSSPCSHPHTPWTHTQSGSKESRHPSDQTIYTEVNLEHALTTATEKDITVRSDHRQWRIIFGFSLLSQGIREHGAQENGCSELKEKSNKRTEKTEQIIFFIKKTTRFIKPKREIWVRHAECMPMNTYKTKTKNLKGKDHLG